MNGYIKIAVFFLLGIIGGFNVPGCAQNLIDFKRKQKRREIPIQSKCFSVSWKVFSALVSAIGLGMYAGFDIPWFLMLILSAIWFIGFLILLVDIRIRIIPNEMVLLLFILAGIFRSMMDGFETLVNNFVTMFVVLILCSVFTIIIGPGKMGAGDVKLCTVLGFMFGYPNVMVVILVATVTMFLFCLAGILVRFLTKSSVLPMGPFLMMGMFIGIPFLIIR